MFADVIDEALPGRNLVALTFDDGPDPSSTPFVLETLARYDAKATFFVIAKKAEVYPQLMTAIVQAGHEVGLHGYCHSRLTAFRSAEWMTQDFKRACHVLSPWVNAAERYWFRPPIGHVTPRLAAVAKRQNLEILCWTIRGIDGLPGVSTEKVVRRVIPKLRDGAIVALHDAFEKQPGLPAGARALPSILEALRQQGLKSVTVTELLGGKNPERPI
jgi:peptidoglycan/xylan/chitin deacetylase (PgdA/CDA1 family)